MQIITEADKAYTSLIRKILREGKDHKDRTGTGTKRIFGESIRFNVREQFPIVTLKKSPFKNTVRELIWFLSDPSCNIENLKALGGSAFKWWSPFSQPDGSIGPMYGTQLNTYNNTSLNQLSSLIKSINDNPNSRRHLLTTYNPLQAEAGSLFPCHGLLTQFSVDNGVLNMSTLQRSADLSLGVPSNWISYALLFHLVAALTNLTVGHMYYVMNDVHIYNDHLSTMTELEQNFVFSYSNPSFSLVNVSPYTDLSSLSLDNFRLSSYSHGGFYNLSMSV